MPIREQHYKWGWEDKHQVRADQIDPRRGLNLGEFFVLEAMGIYPTSEEVLQVRHEAYLLLKKLGGTVIVTISDAFNAVENDRNAPLCGETRKKKNTGNSGDQYYNWKSKK